MAALTSEQKTFIVAAIARYKTPSQVAADVKAEFDVEIDRQQVRYYNPQQNPKCPDQWVQLFNEERKNFLDDRARIGIANRAYRLQKLGEMLDTILSSARPNMVLALEILKQAAQDEGGMFDARKKDEGGAPPLPASILDAIQKVYGSPPPAPTT